MVFVFQKSAYGSGSKQSPWKQRRIMLGLFLSVVAYVLVGAGMFMWINPEFSSQGSDDKFETTFRDAVYFATVTVRRSRCCAAAHEVAKRLPAHANT